jgi:hypothetical protein
VPLPKEENEEGGAVVLVDPSTPLFDLGPGENWRRLMGERWWEWLIPSRERCVFSFMSLVKPKLTPHLSHSRVTDFEFNSTVLSDLGALARKQQ